MGPPPSCQHAQSHCAHAALLFPFTWLKCTVNELTTRALLPILPSKLHQTKLLSYLENYCQSMAGLNYHFQLAMLSLCQSPCCHICFLGTDWFLNTNWSFSSALSWRHQMKLAGSRFKTSKTKSFKASCCKMWQVWEVHRVSWGDRAISWQTNALKINKSVESTPGPGSPVPLMAGGWESTWWRYHFIHFRGLLLLATERNRPLGCTDL